MALEWGRALMAALILRERDMQLGSGSDAMVKICLLALDLVSTEGGNAASLCQIMLSIVTRTTALMEREAVLRLQRFLCARTCSCLLHAVY